MERELNKDLRFDDCCGHGESCYVGSFAANDNGRARAFDLYLFPERGESSHICLRYGDEPSEYVSPGTLAMLAARLEGPKPRDSEGNEVDWPQSYVKAIKAIRLHLAGELAEICRNRACHENDILFEKLASFIDLFALDRRDI